MSKYPMILRVFTFLGKSNFIAIFPILFLTFNCVQGQSSNNASNSTHSPKPSQSAKTLLPDRVSDHWRAISQIRVLNAGQISSSSDADIYAEYGLQRAISRVYTNGKSKISIEIIELNFAPNAYGLFTLNRGRLPHNFYEFYKGRYVVRYSTPLLNNQEDPSFLEAIKANLTDDKEQLPSLPSHLPDQDKIAESEKYIVGPMALSKLENFSDLKNVINFDAGMEITTGDYHNGSGRMSLVIIEYHTPQSASDGYTKLQSYFSALPQSEKDRQIIKRTGNYVITAVNIQDLPAAQNIINQIKYETKIYWAGRKASDIPLEFRPPDPVAIQEATRTVQVLLRSFYWIGVMLLTAILLGISAGGLLFCWNRYRHYKLGLDNAFTDGGGSLRLNLDDYPLTREFQIKQSEKDNGYSGVKNSR